MTRACRVWCPAESRLNSASPRMTEEYTQCAQKGQPISMFSSRIPFPDTLKQRSREAWYGTHPVTLTRRDVSIDGTRMGRFGGVLVYRPKRDIDLGPDRGHRVWSNGAFAELHDEEWEAMGWKITRRHNNPTNPHLAAHRQHRESVISMGLDPMDAHLFELDSCAVGDMNEFGVCTAENIEHARAVLTRVRNVYGSAVA